MRDRGPDAGSSEDPPRSWWSVDRSSSAQDLPVAALSTAHQARNVASDALCRSHPNGPGLSPGPGHAARLHLRRRFVKNNGFAGTRTPSLDEYHLPCAGLRRPKLSPRAPDRAQLAPCLAEDHRIVSSMPPGPRCLHRGTGFRRPFTTRTRGKGGQTQADSWASLRLAANGTLGPDAARRLLQPEQPASTTVRPLDPRGVRPTGRVQLALDWEETSGRGWGPFRLIGRRLQVTPQHPRRANLAARRGASAGRQPRFHEPGAGRLSPPGASRHPARKQGTELGPDPIRSDTSRHETVPAAGGRPTAARTTSPRKPALTGKHEDLDLRSPDCLLSRGRRPGRTAHDLY